MADAMASKNSALEIAVQKLIALQVLAANQVGTTTINEGGMTRPGGRTGGTGACALRAMRDPTRPRGDPTTIRDDCGHPLTRGMRPVPVSRGDSFRPRR